MLGLEAGEKKSHKRNKNDKKSLDRGSSEEKLVVENSKSTKKGLFGVKKHHKEKGRDSPRKKDKKAHGVGHLQPRRPVFGVPLEDAVANNRCHDGVPVPLFIRQCIDHINVYGLRTEGIFRIAPPKEKLQRVAASLDAGAPLKLNDQYVASELVKHFLRELPEHILTQSLVDAFEKVALECPCRTLYCACLTGDRIKALSKQLPPCNYALLGYIFKHVQSIIRNQEHNKMSLPNMGIILQPTLRMSQRLLNIFLRNTGIKQKEATSLFDDVEIKKYVAPLRPSLDRLAQSLPTTKERLEEELKKQQSLLTQLHEEMSFREKSSQVEGQTAEEQQLWEVQMFATQIKRKLKSLAKSENETNSTSQVIKNSGPKEHGPCIEMFNEKQLLAVQMELRQMIDAEKKAITELETLIKSKIAAGAKFVPITLDDDEKELTIAQWKSKVRDEESRRDHLISEIISERNLCAKLEAEIEILTIQKNNHDNSKSVTKV